ncbi:hypothetical protein HYFRA_00011122 [Hymenoscyphus fraxineus]|uniref:Uncharacterized protein n=1 Tax=Hymenoscyphus fraxineus TaxID=746836 RepID=A0A9N9PWL9_9HELO|nr:hypothetical protein HYFRA_00011122 [Hymenoscyphus fraxineus]
MFNSMLKATLFAALLSTCSGLKWGEIKPYKDAQCKEELKFSFKEDPLDKGQTFKLGKGVGAPEVGNKWKVYKDTKFENAAAPNGGVGNWVYWDTGPIPSKCSVVFMQPYAGNVASGAMAKGQAPGNVVLTTSKSGCYFTQIPVASTFYTTFCCGTQCDHYKGDAPDGAGKPKKRSEIPAMSQEDASAIAAKDTVVEAAVSTRNSGSLAARAAAIMGKRETCASTDKACADKVWAGCKIENGQPRLTAGLQVAVSNIQTAQSGPGVTGSSISSSLSFTIGTSTSVSTTRSFSSTQGLSMTVTEGVTFPIEAQVAVAASVSFTEGLDKTTGHDSSKSKQVSVTYTMGMVPGTSGFMSFTPYYDCYSPVISCGKEKTWGAIDVCYPHLLGDGTPKGEYTIVVT